jgi:hypothetical protein
VALQHRDYEFDLFAGGGKLQPADPDYFAKLYAGTAKAPSASLASRARKTPTDSLFQPRRGLLLTAEQLAGPPAPAYLLRSPYVFGRQNLL